MKTMIIARQLDGNVFTFVVQAMRKTAARFPGLLYDDTSSP